MPSILGGPFLWPYDGVAWPGEAWHGIGGGGGIEEKQDRLNLLELNVIPLGLDPFRTAVPLWEQSSQFLSSLAPKRDCSRKGAKDCTPIVGTKQLETRVGFSFLHSKQCATVVKGRDKL